MRNAILQADVNRRFGDRDRIWAVFAARGMGLRASTTGDGDINPVEDFTRPPPLPVPDVTKPVVSRLSMTRRRFRVGRSRTPRTARTARGTAFRFRLSEGATVKITIHRALSGRRVGKRCRRPTRALRKRRKCTRYVGRGTLHAPQPEGGLATGGVQRQDRPQRAQGGALSGHDHRHRRRQEPLPRAPHHLQDRATLAPSARLGHERVAVQAGPPRGGDRRRRPHLRAARRRGRCRGTPPVRPGRGQGGPRGHHAPPGLDFAVLLHAAPRIGAALVPLNTRLPEAEQRRQARLAGADTVVRRPSTASRRIWSCAASSTRRRCTRCSSHRAPRASPSRWS